MNIANESITLASDYRSLKKIIFFYTKRELILYNRYFLIYKFYISQLFIFIL